MILSIFIATVSLHACTRQCGCFALFLCDGFIGCHLYIFLIVFTHSYLSVLS